MGKYRKILVIEDEIPLIEALEAKLKRSGYTVLMAHDGVTGLATALTVHPDLILLDLLLPEMDGLTVLKRLAADPVGKNIPVIVLSNISADDHQILSEALEIGAYDIMDKVDSKLGDVVKRVKDRLGDPSSSS